MITMKDFLECAQYKITGGDKFQWQCYGSSARMLDINSNWNEEYSASIVFDTETQVVYEVTVCDIKNSRAYRLTHPDFIEKRKEEAKSRDVDNDQAWDDVKFIDLDVEDDFLDKMTAIVAGEEYDDRVVVPVELDTDHLFLLMQEAHKQDLTLNEYFDKMIKEYIEFL